MLNVLFLLCFILCLLAFETGSLYYVAMAVLELTTLDLAGIELTEFNVLTPQVFDYQVPPHLTKIS